MLLTFFRGNIDFTFPKYPISAFAFGVYSSSASSMSDSFRLLAIGKSGFLVIPLPFSKA